MEGGEGSYLAYPKSILTNKDEGNFGPYQNNLGLFVHTVAIGSLLKVDKKWEIKIQLVSGICSKKPPL